MISYSKLFDIHGVNAKTLRSLNFEPDEQTKNDKKLKCIRVNCFCRRADNNGHGNLYGHIVSHDDWLEFYNISVCKSGPIDNFVEKFSLKTECIYGWLEFIVKTHQPFNCVNDPNYRNFSKFESICKNTEIKYFDLVVIAVFEKIKSELPETFGAIFDGKCFES